MQGLESRHHLAHQLLEGGRAAKLPSVCAQLRRRQNPDLRDSRFRASLEHYMSQLDEFVQPLHGSESLQKLKPTAFQKYSWVYSSSLNSMHQSVEQETMTIEAFKASLPRPLDKALPMGEQEGSFVAEHMRAILEEGGLYCVEPEVTSGPGAGKPFLFQMVSAHPERKATIERMSQMAEVTWAPGMLAIATLQIDPNRPGGEEDHICSLDMEPESLDLFEFFAGGCHERLYTFQLPIVRQVLLRAFGPMMAHGPHGPL